MFTFDVVLFDCRAAVGWFFDVGTVALLVDDAPAWNKQNYDICFQLKRWQVTGKVPRCQHSRQDGALYRKRNVKKRILLKIDSAVDLLLICDGHWISWGSRLSLVCGPLKRRVLVAVKIEKKIRAIRTIRRLQDIYADPWVFEGFGGRDALGGVDSQHLIDQIFGVRCHRVPFRRRILIKGTRLLLGQITKHTSMRELRHRLQLWSVRTIDAGPRPRKEGIQPIKCTKWHLILKKNGPKIAWGLKKITAKCWRKNLPQAQISTGLP